MERKIIHAGCFEDGTYVLLRQEAPDSFKWWTLDETDTGVSASTVEEAIRLANKAWKGFRTVICGFRYTLPERDEHGMNALFHQMVASYSTPNGVYLDEDLGHMCHVQFASQEALNLWKKLK